MSELIRNPQRSRASRRRALALGLTAGGSAALLAACGGGSGGDSGAASSGAGTTPAAGRSAPAAAAGPPKRGGTIRISNYLNPLHLDNLQGSSSQAILLAPAMDALLAYQTGPDVGVNSQKLKLGLAAAMPEYADPTTLVVKLNPAAKWETGQPVTAEDVKFTLERVRDGAPTYTYKPQLSIISNVTAVDPQTVQIKTTAPSAALISYLAGPNVSIVNKEAYERLGDYKQTVVGSGPYKVERFEPNIQLSLVRTPNYWNADKEGWADRIEWSIIEDDSTRLAAYQAGKHDIEGLFPFLSVEMKKQVEASDTEFFEGQTQYGAYIAMHAQKAPFNDERVRKAFQLTLNRQQMIATWCGGKGKMNGPIAAAYSDFALSQDDLAKRPGFRGQKAQDIAEAKKLLEAAGVRSLTVPALGGERHQSASPMLQIMRTNLQQVAVTLDLQIMENATVDSRVRAGDYIVVQRPYTTRVDPTDVLVTDYHSRSPQAWCQAKDTTLDAMIDKQASTLDARERKRLVDEIQEYLLDKSYYVYTVDRDAWVGYRPKKVAGFIYNLYARGAALRDTWVVG
jgi:peptide/nickel transport system substrate-binding protein